MPGYPVALAYNPDPYNPPPELNFGPLGVVYPGSPPDFVGSDWGGLNWWAPPADPSGAYWIIGTYVGTENHPTPLGNVGGVQFWRTASADAGEFAALWLLLSGFNANGNDLDAYKDLDTNGNANGASVRWWTNWVAP